MSQSSTNDPANRSLLPAGFAQRVLVVLMPPVSAAFTFVVVGMAWACANPGAPAGFALLFVHVPLALAISGTATLIALALTRRRRDAVRVLILAIAVAAIAYLHVALLVPLEIEPSQVGVAPGCTTEGLPSWWPFWLPH